MRANYPLVWVAGFVALTMHSGFACSSGAAEEEFQYSEAEMVAAVQGTWRLTISRPEGDGTVTFTLAPGPAATHPLSVPQPSRTPLCGNRSFVRPAAGCISTSTLHLTGELLRSEPAVEAKSPTGAYNVMGLHYNGGRLSLSFGSALKVSADLDPNNAVRETYTDEKGARIASRLEKVP